MKIRNGQFGRKNYEENGYELSQQFCPRGGNHQIIFYAHHKQNSEAGDKMIANGLHLETLKHGNDQDQCHKKGNSSEGRGFYGMCTAVDNRL